MDNNKEKADVLEKRINKILFPYRKQNLNKEKSIINNGCNKIDNKQEKEKINTQKEKSSKKKSKEGLTIYEKYIKYKKAKQLYEYSLENNNVLSQNKITSEKKSKILDQSKEEEKEINNTCSDESQNNYNIIYKLIKDIPNLSRKNQEKYPFSSTDYNQTKINEYYDNKIYFISKIIDIDLLTEIYEEEYNELLWVQDYKKIYEYLKHQPGSYLESFLAKFKRRTLSST